MNLRTVAALSALVLASFANAQTTDRSDLIFNSLEIMNIEFVDNRFEISVGYELVNIGDRAIDLDGPIADDLVDNVSIQTYLTLDPGLTGPVYAGGGGVITDPVILNPGSSYKGTYISNTAQMPDPGTLDPALWIMLDILTPSIPDEIDTNNRAFIQVPAPGGAALLAVVGLGVMRRRR